MKILRQKINLHFICFLFLTIIFSPFILVQAAEEPEFDLTAKSAVLMEAETGEIVYSKNPNKRLPPASMTKVMTMLLVMEAIEDGRVSLDDEIVVSEYAASMGGSQIWLEVGEKMTLDELMRAIAIASANDASVAVAEYLYGTADNFIERMNERARELGLEDTYFYNTTGLPPGDADVEGNYSSAYDLAVLSRELLKYPQIVKWTSTWIDYLRDGDSVLNNTNRLVRHYRGADGLKTGFIQEAKFCVASTATRNNLRFISVILGADTSDDRFNEAARLLTYGFNIYEALTIADKGEVIAEIDIKNSRQDKVKVTIPEELSIPLRKDEEENINRQIGINKNIKAPLKAGDPVGKMTILKNNSIINEVDLIVDQDVEKANISQMIAKFLNQVVIDITKLF